MKWIVAAFTLLIAAPAVAQSPVWQVTTADDGALSYQQAVVESMNDGTIKLSTGDLDSSSVGRLWRDGAVDTTRWRGTSMLHLVGGDRIRGTLVDFDGDTLVWRSSILDNLDVSVDNILAILPDGAVPPTEPPLDDTIVLANGDRISGFLESAADSAWTISPDQGDELVVAAENIDRIIFSGGQAREISGDRWHLSVDDGSRMTFDDFFILPDGVRGKYFGREVGLALPVLLGIDHAGGRIVWLSDLPTESLAITPYFGESPAVPRLLRPAGSQFESVPTRQSFVLPSKSLARWQVPAGGRRFVARVGIDPDAGAQLADVDVVIRVDGESKFEQTGLGSGDAFADISIDVAAGQSLEIEIGYGQGLDVQDRVLLLDPAFLLAD